MKYREKTICLSNLQLVLHQKSDQDAKPETDPRMVASTGLAETGSVIGLQLEAVSPVSNFHLQFRAA